MPALPPAARSSDPRTAPRPGGPSSPTQADAPDFAGLLAGGEKRATQDERIPTTAGRPGQHVDNHGRARSAEVHARNAERADARRDRASHGASEGAKDAAAKRSAVAVERVTPAPQDQAGTASSPGVEREPPSVAPAPSTPDVPAVIAEAEIDPAAATDPGDADALHDTTAAHDAASAESVPTEPTVTAGGADPGTTIAATPPEVTVAPVPVNPSVAAAPSGAPAPLPHGPPSTGPAEAALDAPRATPPAHAAAAAAPPGLARAAQKPATAAFDAPEGHPDADQTDDAAAGRETLGDAVQTTEPQPSGRAGAAPRATPPAHAAVSDGPPRLDGVLPPAQDTTAPVLPGTAAPAALAAVAARGPEARAVAGGSGRAAEPAGLKRAGADAGPAGSAANPASLTAAVFELPGDASSATPQPATGPADARAQGTASVAAPTPPVPIALAPIEIGMRALEGVQRFEIRLHPEEYGRIDVKLDLDGDGGVRAHMIVDRPETLALLQKDARALERAFEQAGLKTGDGALQFSLGQGGEQGQRGAASQQRQHSGLHREAATVAEAKAALRAIRAATSGLDIRI